MQTHPNARDRGEHTFPTAPGTDRLPLDTPIRRRFFERRLRTYRDAIRDRLLTRYDRANNAVRHLSPDEMREIRASDRTAMFRFAALIRRFAYPRESLRRQMLDRYAADREAQERARGIIDTGADLRARALSEVRHRERVALHQRLEAAAVEMEKAGREVPASVFRARLLEGLKYNEIIELPGMPSTVGASREAWRAACAWVREYKPEIVREIGEFLAA